MKAQFFLLTVATALAISACGSDSSFYDSLTDDQKKDVSLDGFKVLQCVGISSEELSDANTTYDLDDHGDAIRLDLGMITNMLSNSENVSFDNIKATENPFAAMTLDVSYNGDNKVIYFYDGEQRCGYSLTFESNADMSGEVRYDIEKARVMTWAAEKGLVASDWQVSTSKEEQLIWTLVYFSRVNPSDVNAMMKFTPVTIDGKQYRVITVLGH